jgi:hypothetical protein
VSEAGLRSRLTGPVVLALLIIAILVVSGIGYVVLVGKLPVTEKGMDEIDHVVFILMENHA